MLRDFLGRMRRQSRRAASSSSSPSRARCWPSRKIILLDEPTEGIQPNIVEQIEQAIVRLNREHGITIVLVEQNVDFARRAPRSVSCIMEKGRVAAKGAVAELTEDSGPSSHGR